MEALKLYIPTRWADLSKRQLLFMANLWQFNHGEQDFITRAFLFLSGLKVARSPKPEARSHLFTHKTLKHPVSIDPELIAIMADKCRYLLTPDEIRPLRWIRLARARHYRLYNATLEEYLMAENYYFAYTQTRNTAHLAHLIAVLYRLPWQRWDAEKIQRRSARFARLPNDVRNTAFMWYVGFRGFVAKRCPTLFKPGGGSSDFNAREYINSMVHALNGGDITRTDNLLKQPLWYALDELEQRAREAEEREQLLKQR